MKVTRRFWSLLLLGGLFGSLNGCGTSSAPSVADNTPQNSLSSDAESPDLTLAIPGAKPAARPNPQGQPAANAPRTAPTPTGKTAATSEAPAIAAKATERGTPEWLLLEIQRIKILPLPGSAAAAPAADPDDDTEDLDADDKPLTAQDEQKLKEEFEKTRAVRRERNLAIIKLAEECIAKTARQKDQEAEFDAAVHYLLDARLQLALQGDAASIDALFDAAKVFYELNPKSTAAQEAELTLVNLTHANALRYGQSEPKWIQEFARHAQLFATRFPEEDRAVALLLAAARTCELAGLNDETRSCYTLLMTSFKDSPQAVQATGVVRRMQLKGKVLDLAGPTMDGGEYTIEAHRGKMVLVVFWATHARPFHEQLPKITATMKKYEKYAVAVGVNLDADESAVEAFLEKNPLTWPQIFSPNRDLRGWNSPLAIHYGINALPTIWLVDPNGIVADTAITADTLEPRMREVYLPFLKNAAVRPTSGTK